MNASSSRGGEIEERARQFLLGKGMRTLEQNFRSRRGEIDLIMLDGESLVFVEVRYRRNNLFGSAAESVTRRKQSKIILAARQYLRSRREWANHPCRFDVMAIDGCGEGRIDWIKDAFQPS